MAAITGPILWAYFILAPLPIARPTSRPGSSRVDNEWSNVARVRQHLYQRQAFGLYEWFG